MELWIRSQDKKRLIKVFDVYIEGTYGTTIKANHTGYYGGSDYSELAEYRSKERALEVLDEIQKLLQPKVVLKYDAFLHPKDIEKIKEEYKKEYNNEFMIIDKPKNIMQMPKTCIYEMPKE